VFAVQVFVYVLLGRLVRLEDPLPEVHVAVDISDGLSRGFVALFPGHRWVPPRGSATALRCGASLPLRDGPRVAFRVGLTAAR